MADALGSAPDDMVGTVETARASMRPLVIMFTIMLIFGLGMTIFGATGLGYLDPAASPAVRERMMDAMRAPVMGGGAAMMALGGLGRWAFSSVVKSIDRSEPKGDARRSPIAWMMHISRIGRGKWSGPYEGRATSLQRYSSRNGGSTTVITFDVGAHARVAWTRRPAIGATIDRLAGMESEDAAPHGFPKNLEVSMSERPWATELFDAPGVREAVATLTNDEPFVLVIVRPGKLSAHYPGGPQQAIDEASLRAKLAALTSIANAIERFGDKYS